MDKSRESNARIIFPLILIFIFLTFITIYTTRMLFDASVSNIHEVGEDRIAGVGAELENYLYTAKSVLWVTADTVDYMSRNNISNDQIRNYLVEESDRQAKQFDDSYTGIYGYINGEYLDGVGWEPPAGYEPTERDWYKVGSAAGGESAIVPPYVDAQTGAIIISISRKLPSSTDVLSLDLTLDNVQRMASQLKVKGKGSGFVIDGSGLIIAHTNEKNKGKYLGDVIPDAGLLNEIKANGQGYFVATIEGDKNTIFVEPVMDQWYAVITISDRELFQDVVRQMIINVVICASIFIMIAFFYSLSFKNERDYSRRVQEMKLEEQAQAQERKALELEKNAADESSKAKTDFIAGMSGKIQKPVNEIISMNEQILAETDDERIRTNAVGIRRTGRKVLSIINDIIDLSKIETGKMELSVSEYETADLIDDFVKETKADAEEKGLDYILSVSDNIPSKLVG
nr:hypothetical protein [Lachnospiraceae bacterium]